MVHGDVPGMFAWHDVPSSTFACMHGHSGASGPKIKAEMHGVKMFPYA